MSDLVYAETSPDEQLARDLERFLRTTKAPAYLRESGQAWLDGRGHE